MGVSVDDLAASLSANHIGQEATDLAVLEAQLAQALLTHQLSRSPHNSAVVHGVSVNIARRDPANVQHCTTPTARTPSSSTFTWPLPSPEHADHSRKRSASFARRQSVDGGWCDFEQMDEERVVEDMITPDSPRFQNTYLWSTYRPDVHDATASVLAAPAPTPISASSPTDACPSLFTSTDPFYLQASQSQSHSSFFSHVAMPSSRSPFMVGVPSWQ